MLHQQPWPADPDVDPDVDVPERPVTRQSRAVVTRTPSATDHAAHTRHTVPTATIQGLVERRSTYTPVTTKSPGPAPYLIVK